MRLEIDDASCGYAEGAPVIEHISFSIGAGRICCVLGPNGCGKTTLFRSILGLQPLLSGKVLINGNDTVDWTPSRRADAMAFVSQSHNPPFPYKVRDVVMLGRTNQIGYRGKPTEHDERIVDAAMRDMGIFEMRDKPYTKTSGGELKLVMIAQALAQEARILVLDEPTASLDYGNVVRVIGKVRHLAQAGYTIVMTTHSPDHAFMCDSDVVLLQKGQPMIFGPAEEVITEKNMACAYGVQVKIVEFTGADHSTMRLCAPVI